MEEMHQWGCLEEVSADSSLSFGTPTDVSTFVGRVGDDMGCPLSSNIPLLDEEVECQERDGKMLDVIDLNLN